jgi:hypothetical protein
MCRPAVALAAALAASGCSFDPSGEPGNPAPVDPDEPPAPPLALSISGEVIDWRTGAPIPGPLTVALLGFGSSVRSVEVAGSAFRIDGLPPDSAFFLAVHGPEHRRTISALALDRSSLEGLSVPALAEADVAAFGQAFGFAGESALLAVRLLDEGGDPAASIPASELAFADDGGQGAVGPYFLEEDLSATSGRDLSSASGYALFAGMEAGVARLEGRELYGIQMDDVLVEEGSVTLADARLVLGELALPEGVSFQTDVLPIFEARGCVECHTANGEGKQFGDLSLDGLSGSGSHAYEQLTVMVSPKEGVTRVNRQAPPASLILTMPSFQDQTGRHPYATFAGPSDPDYLLILGWIDEGAERN